MNDVIESEIQEFILEQIGSQCHDLTMQTTLQQLGVDGLDAVELMLAFSKRFKVDISSYRHEDYFGDEGISFRNLFRIGPEKQFLRLSDLLVWARAGKVLTQSDAQAVSAR